MDDANAATTLCTRDRREKCDLRVLEGNPAVAPCSHPKLLNFWQIEPLDSVIESALQNLVSNFVGIPLTAGLCYLPISY